MMDRGLPGGRPLKHPSPIFGIFVVLFAILAISVTAQKAEGKKPKPSPTPTPVERDVVLKYSTATGVLVENGTFAGVCQPPIGGCWLVAREKGERSVSATAVDGSGDPVPFSIDPRTPETGDFSQSGHCGSTVDPIPLEGAKDVSVMVYAAGFPPSGPPCDALGDGGTVTITFSTARSS